MVQYINTFLDDPDITADDYSRTAAETVLSRQRADLPLLGKVNVWRD